MKMDLIREQVGKLLEINKKEFSLMNALPNGINEASNFNL